MTAFDVDLDELRDVLVTMAACQRALVDLAGDVEDEHSALWALWAGDAREAHVAAAATWREHCAEMVTALGALRGVAAAAESGYRAAAQANLAMWEQLG